MSLAPQTFLEAVYGIPPVVASIWGTAKVIQVFRAPTPNGRKSASTAAAEMELERTRWSNILDAIEGVGVALKEETELVRQVRANQATVIIPRVAEIHAEVVGRKEEHARLMKDLIDAKDRRRAR